MSAPPPISRRTLMAASPWLAASLKQASATPARAALRFPKNFLWGAATAGHQVEGNNTNADLWVVEHVTPTLFRQPSGDACDSFERWAEDLDIVQKLGLNTYRFALEWSRIEPAQGDFSNAMLDHYQRIIAGCHARNLVPMVTFNHFTTPQWFAAAGGWTNPTAPDHFVRFCDRAARHLATGIGYASTFNEPNLLRLLRWFKIPPQMGVIQAQMLAAAGRATGSPHYVCANVALAPDVDVMLAPMIEGHRRAYDAIKSVRPDLPVGVSLAIEDDQPIGAGSLRDAKRRDAYGPWLAAAKATGDFIGVQNYHRALIGPDGVLPPPPGAALDGNGAEIYPDSLGNAVRYVYEQTGKPIIVTENGVCTANDAQRMAYIPAALASLRQVMAEGVPVHGYVHWSLLDNFEWIFGYGPKYGLCAVDLQTFKRTPKQSAHLLGRIARQNGI